MSQVSLTLLVLKTRQVEQVRLFYQTLGVELTHEQHGKGPVHFAGRAGDVVMEVYPLPDDTILVDTSLRLGFAVEDLVEVIQALERIGARVITPPKETTWGLQGVVYDPDGRSVELTQRRWLPRRRFEKAAALFEGRYEVRINWLPFNFTRHFKRQEMVTARREPDFVSVRGLTTIREMASFWGLHVSGYVEFLRAVLTTNWGAEKA